MRYQDRKAYEAEMDYCRRAVELAEWRKRKERAEHRERLQDKLVLAVLMVAAGLMILMSVYAFASFGHWMMYGV
ncbi:MAG: hypothetical protein IJ723_00115 [Ruminococcus sp.]|nr:hypothetical protein [Ruminococcus sp.]